MITGASQGIGQELVRAAEAIVKALTSEKSAAALAPRTLFLRSRDSQSRQHTARGAGGRVIVLYFPFRQTSPLRAHVGNLELLPAIVTHWERTAKPITRPFKVEELCKAFVLYREGKGLDKATLSEDRYISRRQRCPRSGTGGDSVKDSAQGDPGRTTRA
jgi:hypothetical protein